MRIAIPPKSECTEMRAPGASLRLAQVDRDAAEPREHRAAAESRRAALERHSVEDRDELNLVALLVAARGQRALHDGSSSGKAGIHPEGEEPECSNCTHGTETTGR